ncbi:hypothetical protein EYR40_002964 [Pleurotus pulmonarius]|nr:hypothetical protein EYR40_002964 [Pleurotus pulmonarius]
MEVASDQSTARIDVNQNVLYQASPPLISTVWRLHFINPRESSQNDVFALLHYIDLHIAINVLTVVRTWDDSLPVYWILFETETQALVARGFATNAEGRQSVKVAGALVTVELFHLAEDEESHPHTTPPLEPNRWDKPLKIYSTPYVAQVETISSPIPPSNHHLNNDSHIQQPPNAVRPLHERIQRAPLLERISST